MRLDRHLHEPSLPGLGRDLRRGQHPGHRHDRPADASRGGDRHPRRQLSHERQAHRVTPAPPRLRAWSLPPGVSSAQHQTAWETQPALRYLRSCRSFAATVHPSPLVLKRACTESSPLPAASGPRPCPSRGEHRGRGAKGRRRPQPLHDTPTSTPLRSPLYRLRGNHLCQSLPTPRLLRRAEPGNSTGSARRGHLPSPYHGPQPARNRGPFQARRHRSSMRRKALKSTWYLGGRPVDFDGKKLPYTTAIGRASIRVAWR